MEFKDFICFDAAIPQLQTDQRDEVIAILVEALSNTGKFDSNQAKKFTKAIIKRENEASTGIGKGVAVPHVKHKDVKEVMAIIGQNPDGIDFSSLDKQPVYSVVLLVSPASKPDMHLEAMDKIFRHLQSEKFRKFLRQCQTTDQIKDLFEEADEKPFV